MNLLVIGQVIKASSDAPYLSFKLEFTQNHILEVLKDSEIQITLQENAKRAMFVGQIELSILDAMLRLVNLLNHPKDIPSQYEYFFVSQTLQRGNCYEPYSVSKTAAIAGSSAPFIIRISGCR